MEHSRLLQKNSTSTLYVEYDDSLPISYRKLKFTDVIEEMIPENIEYNNVFWVSNVILPNEDCYVILLIYRDNKIIDYVVLRCGVPPLKVFYTNVDYKSTDNTGFSGIVNIGDKIYVSGANMQENDLTDAMIVMYDTNCNYLKQVTYDAKGTERFNKLVLDDNNNIVAIGTLYTARKNNHNTVDEYDYDGIIAKYNSNLEKLDDVRYGDERDDFFTDVIFIHNKYIIVGYSSYEDGSYMSKFISYSKAFKVLEVE